MGSSTLAATVSQGNRAESWNSMAVAVPPAWRTAGCPSEVPLPAPPEMTDTDPTVGWSSPATRLRSVVLPHPEAPTRQTNRPGATLSEMSCRATTPVSPVPWRFDTPDNVTEGARALTRVAGVGATVVTTSAPASLERRGGS